jgi:uncharacterized protein YkwD
MTHLRIRHLIPIVAAGVALGACTPTGNLDSTGVSATADGQTLTVVGWAWDEDVPTTPIDVHVYIDGNGIATKADLPRPDVAASFPKAGPDHGYQVRVNVAAGSHQICAYGINYPGTGGDNSLLGCTTVVVSSPTTTTAPPTTTTTAPAPTTTVPAVPVDTTWQQDLLDRINASRTTAGAGAVTTCPALATAAQAYADTLAANQWLDPTGPDGSDTWMRVTAYGPASVGENLSFGYATPADVHAGMLASQTQVDNIVRPEFTAVGLGRTWGDPDDAGPTPASYYWVEVFGQGGTC